MDWFLPACIFFAIFLGAVVLFVWPYLQAYF
jgi:hypothetical protein